MKKENLPVNIDSVEDELKVVLQNRKDDYEYARDLLYATAEKLQDILDAAVVMAQESEHPRAVEVATQAAQALGDTAGKMMDHHIKNEKINNPQGNKAPTEVTNNNLNVKLSTKDLLELLTRE
jgi:hypothetical protein